MGPTASELPLSIRDVDTVKAVVATCGAALLAGRALAPHWEGIPAAWRRGWDIALACLGLLAAFCWSNLGQFNFPGFGHPSETFHYYLGAKYFPELGYTRLYECVALADSRVAGGAARSAGRRLRNLETNVVESADAVLEAPDRCTQHFSAERWRAFQADLSWFRDRPNPRRWRVLQLDHGYNATPVWGLFGGALAAGAPASDRKILTLRLIDPVLLLLAFGCVWRSFGWRTLCVALLFFGTHYPAQYGWIGGSYLRQLELAALLVGICALRSGWGVVAGALVSLAALVRIHPAFLVLGPAFQVLGASLRERRLLILPLQRRLLAGGLLGAAVLLVAAATLNGGFAAWQEFTNNSRVLLDTPLRNHMGLATVLAWDPEQTADKLADRSLEDPYLPWKRARRATFEARRPLFVALVAAALALFAWAVQRQPLWVAVVLGAGLIPVATELTCYYSALLVVYALLWERAPWVGAGLVGLAAAGWASVELFHFFDPIFTWLSLVTVVYALTVYAVLGVAATRYDDPAA
ncbi:MAG: hypothetical protein JRH16_10510 [Deltaproteobacteria bacterium]|nr:hypothetical protein [Deltaproteobacteria bacterium]MBW2360417.1 hypothetical protein [Deltaproteobacteria bacterium]